MLYMILALSVPTPKSGQTYLKNSSERPFQCQPHKVVKDTYKICQKEQLNCFSKIVHFWGVGAEQVEYASESVNINV